VPTASAARGRRPVPRECSSTRSSCSGPPTTDDAGAGGPPPAPLGRGGDDGAGGVVQGGPSVDLPGERAEQPLGAGVEGLLGQLALGGEPCGDGPVLIGGDGGGDGLADGEEGGAAGDLQQRQPLLPAGVDEGRRDVLVVDPDGEPEPHDTGPGQPLHIPPHGLRVLGVQLERRDQQQLTALHVRHGVGQLADVGPADGHVETVLARTHGQLQRGVVDERGEGGGHGAFR
jgi:hypothetical protein